MYNMTHNTTHEDPEMDEDVNLNNPFNTLHHKVEMLNTIMKAYPRTTIPYILRTAPKSPILFIFGHLNDEKDRIVYYAMSMRGRIESLNKITINTLYTTQIYANINNANDRKCSFDKHNNKYIESTVIGGYTIYYCSECSIIKDSSIPIIEKKYYDVLSNYSDIMYDVDELVKLTRMNISNS
jgi:hypothetical protein